jgi:hypothetical protein
LKKTENLIWQEDGDSLLDLLKAADPTVALRERPILHHVVNAYDAGTTSEAECHAAVIASMRQAASCAAVDSWGIHFHGVCHADEVDLIPAGFEGHPVISRSIRNDARYSGCKPVPYLFDILAPLRGGEVGEWVVFTNMDIVLQPWFYTSVLEMLDAGFDSLIINRRTQPAEYSGCREWLLRSEIGVSHPGMDCFVFPRSWIEEFVVSDAVVGAENVMRSLLYNLVCKAKKMAFVTRAMLTLHLGDDRPWLHPPMDSLQDHNAGEALKTWQALSEASDFNRERLSEMAEKLPWFAPSAMGSKSHSEKNGNTSENALKAEMHSSSGLNHEEVVQQVYQSILGREADAGGLEHYSRVLSEPGGVTTCLNAMIGSAEFANKIRAAKRKIHFSKADLEQEKIVFLHIPKTGGTSLHHLLTQGRSDGEICPERFNGLHAFTAGELVAYRIFSGHFDHPSTELIPGRKAVITMLREPVSRLVSLFHFQKSHRDEVIERDRLRLARLAKDHSMEEFFRLEEIRNHPSINNAMTRMLSERVPSWRWEGGNQQSETLHPPNLDLARKNLEGFRAFGLMERYEDSVRVIFEKLGLPIPQEIPRKMVLDHIMQEDPGLQAIEKQPITPVVRDLLEDLVNADRKLYASASDRFMNM